MIFDELTVPVVLAPLAGGPSTPELAAAVSEAGGLGFVAAGYLTADALGDRIAAARRLTARPLAVNVFAPGDGPSDPAVYRPYMERLEQWAKEAHVELGEPRYSDDDWDAKIELLRQDPVEVVSFTFGCPPPDVLGSLRAAGSEVWVTVTSPEEAEQAADAGAQTLVVQGGEAGGHRASFSDRPDLPVYGLLPLLALVRAAVSLPLVASGGIASADAVAAALAAGASAAQVGTAFMLAPEAGTSPAHRAALRTGGPTALTRAFSGRLARGIRNRFLDEHSADAPVAYPEIHYVTSPMRAKAREAGDADLINLWAGEAHRLALELPAAEIVELLGAQASGTADEAAPVAHSALEELAHDWYDAWNAHDLDRVLSHYTDDVVFSSPFIAALGSNVSGALNGKEALRAYWERALKRYPDLHFEPIAQFYGVGSVTLHYRGVEGVLAAEVLEVGSDGLVYRAAAHYNRMP